MASDSDTLSISQASAISPPTWRPLEADLITDYNWGTGALLAYIGVHLSPALLPVEIESLPMRIAASFSGWICVLFLTRTSYRVMPMWIAAILTLCMLGFPPLAWLFIGLILVIATQEIRKAGYRFGLLGNAKPPVASISSAPATAI
ncbi:MAG: hypothetical protein AAFX06_06810 [Planctomycetota bacterium]